MSDEPVVERTPFELLERKRFGNKLEPEEVRAIVRGAADESWSDAELGAFLMAAAIQGLDVEETASLTAAMLESGEQWNLGNEVPLLVDKHSTGGVGDKVSLILSPLLAACGVPVVMLTGRALGHSGGTADKLESIPGVRLDFDRSRCLELLSDVGIAMGIATEAIAPADRRLYALRDRTGTVSSISLVVGSILSKKLATGASAIVFDVKTGSGAFFTEEEAARELCRQLVGTCQELGVRSSGLITDMSEPLGGWVGHSAEVMESLACLEGRGNSRLMEVVFSLCEEAARLVGAPVDRTRLEEAIGSGEARSRFIDWAIAQGASASFLRHPDFDLGPVEAVIEANRHGVLSAVDTQRIGHLLSDAARRRDGHIDYSVSLAYKVEIGDQIEPGQELCRLYLGTADPQRVRALTDCFQIADEGAAPALIRDTIR